MKKFWRSIILPILEKDTPETIVEIGAESGESTKNILEYCEMFKIKCHVIDPEPIRKFNEIEDKLKRYGQYHRALSLETLPRISGDVYLLDGDHNWYTVYEELKIIFSKINSSNSQKKPILFFHDVAWPYARRDLYYNPETIPEEFRHSYDFGGVVLGKSELASSKGINLGLANACHEGGKKNGVLTAIEDFIYKYDLDNEYIFKTLPIRHGLGILYPKTKPDDLQNLIDSLFSLGNLDNLIKTLDKERLEILIEKFELEREVRNQIMYLEKERQEYSQLRQQHSQLQQKYSHLQQEHNKLQQLTAVRIARKLSEYPRIKKFLLMGYRIFERMF